ncbi:hypothetical protein C8R47DRAFT_964785, partial [Mycena vitilis]
TTVPDPFFGNRYIALLSAEYIVRLFGCSPYASDSPPSSAYLPHFIAFVIYRTQLQDFVLYTALVLLNRLRFRYPLVQGTSGHRLFLIAFMLSCKFVHDENYSNIAWSRVAQEIWSVQDINEMERDMCYCLDWDLTINNETLANFRTMFWREFAPNAWATNTTTIVPKRMSNPSPCT